MTSIESIGENLRLHRLRKGLSQEQLALSAGVNTSYIGQLERGEKNPTVKILDKIASALEVTTVELIAPNEAKGGGLSCHHHKSQHFTILTPEDIKQYLTEVIKHELLNKTGD